VKVATMNNALIIFARKPVPGKVKTRLIPHLSAGEAAQLYHCMLTDILNKSVSICETDKILFYEDGRETEDYFRANFPSFTVYPQQGEVLGMRMQTAFDHTFAMGYRSVAIIGTDSPDLPAAHIEESFRLLEKGGADVVFGPAEDGGYYLLAMKRTHGELFRGIDWSSGQVLRQSLAKAELSGLSCKTLPVWYDVDTPADLERPGLADTGNCAPLTRRFLEQLFLKNTTKSK
jgi:rSAM/selenodomain-associated transferase 1